MPSRIECDNGHLGGNRREAAIKIAKDGNMGVCQCGAQKHWRMSYDYPSDVHEEFEVVHVERLYANQKDEDLDYDPMILVLRSTNGDLRILPQYWIYADGSWRYGQYSPLMMLKDWERLLHNIPSQYR